MFTGNQPQRLTVQIIENNRRSCDSCSIIGLRIVGQNQAACRIYDFGNIYKTAGRPGRCDCTGTSIVIDTLEGNRIAGQGVVISDYACNFKIPVQYQRSTRTVSRLDSRIRHYACILDGIGLRIHNKRIIRGCNRSNIGNTLLSDVK